MEIVTETNEWYDVVVYPQKEEDVANKQGLAMKGSRDEYGKMIECWKRHYKLEMALRENFREYIGE